MLKTVCDPSGCSRWQSGDRGQFAIPAPVPRRYTVGVRSDRWGLPQTDVAVGDEEQVSVEVQFPPRGAVRH